MLRVGRFNFGDERIQSPWEANVQTTLESVLEQRKQRWELLVEQIVRNWKEELGKKSKSTFQHSLLFSKNLTKDFLHKLQSSETGNDSIILPNFKILKS